MQVDAYRVFGQPLFWVSLCLFTLSRLSVAVPEYSALFLQNPGTGLAASQGYLYYASFFLSSPVNVFAVSIACLPYGMAYLEDRACDFDRYFISRTKIWRYSLSKYLINLLSTILMSIMGFLLTIFIFFLLCKGQMGHFMASGSNSWLFAISTRQPWLYIALLTVFSSMYCGLWSCFVLLISAYLKNLYVILALTYAGITITAQLNLARQGWPMFSNLAMRGAWLAVGNISPFLAILLNLIQYSFLYAVFFVLFHLRVKKNYERK